MGSAMIAKVMLILILAGPTPPSGIDNPNTLTPVNSGQVFNTMDECAATGEKFVGHEGVRGYLCVNIAYKGEPT